MNFLLVFIGGGFGCIARYLIGLGFQRTSLTLPYATLVANVCACIIFVITLWLMNVKDMNSANLRLLMITGFCGGLSTFSSFGYETFLLLKQSLFLFAALNIIVNTIACIFIFYLFNK